jgi:GTP-binding protein
MGDHAGRQGAEKIAALFPPEPTFEDGEIEAGRRLFAGECRFVAAAAHESDLPRDDLPEVAFLGRSNVGKSSLLNALAGRVALARVSHTPGRTRQIVFFALRSLMLADLPGYGFAAAPKQEIARWSRLVPLYAKGRAGLKRALLLVDARHGFMASDRDFMKLLDEAAVSYQVVLTKCDKLAPAALAERLHETAAELSQHPAAHPQIHATSAHAGFGIAELRAALARLAAPVAAR